MIICKNYLLKQSREEEAKRPEDDEEPKEDFSALKDALSGLKLGGAIGGGKSQQNKIESNTTIPADTPLNTQIDGVNIIYKKKLNQYFRMTTITSDQSF